MKDSTLELIKSEINNEKAEIARHNKDVDRVNALLESDDVKEYFELVGIEPIRLQHKVIDEYKIVKRVFERIIWRIDEKDTNGIYVYKGTYMVDNCCDIVHGPSDIRVERDYPFATHRDYWDIEQHYAIEVPIKKCDEFERTHDVIYLSSNYHSIRQEFIEEALEHGQEEAVNKIKKKYLNKRPK